MRFVQPKGFKAFTIVWFGQIISLMGSSMTAFALIIWAYQATGQATSVALMSFFSFGPSVLFSPVAGALVDRWNKKWVMAISDLATGLATIALFILWATGILQIWHIYVGGAIAGIFQAFQWPAYSAAITVMVPKEQYTRAAGMMSLADFGAGVFAPVLAGALIGFAGIGSVFIIDIVTFCLAIGALLVIHIPPVPRSAEGDLSRGSLFQESMFGFKYILSRPSLLGLQLIFFFGNFLASITNTLVSPMILARTDNNAQILGIANSVASAGGIVGGLIISTWGGPKKKSMAVIWCWFFQGLGALLWGLNFGLPIWLVAGFFTALMGPFINSSNQAIWQSKVQPDLQGRVFAARRMIAQIVAPLGMLVAGPLADYVLEPAMRDPNSGLANLLGGVAGIGPGAGMALIMSACGLLVLVVALVANGVPAIRNAETLLPDHDQIAETPAAE